MWIILLSPVPERYFFLSFLMYFLACLLLLLLLFFAAAAVFFLTYSLFVFLNFQLSLEELLGDNSLVHPSMHCVIVIIDKAKCSFLVV